MKNAWNHDILSIDEIIFNPICKNLISDSIHQMLGSIDKSPQQIQEILDILFDTKPSHSILDLEKILHVKITSQGESKEEVRSGMNERAKTIYSQIETYLQGESLADIGCGSGLISWLSRDHFKDISLFDIIDYRDVNVILPFIEYPENTSPPFDRLYDCTLLLTVLHHADDPLKLLQDVWKYTRKRLIIIESVFDSSPSQSILTSNEFNKSKQFINAIFCDWFYNRVLNQDVNVPYNFDTPKNWCLTFEQLPAIISVQKDLGIDIEIVPEHHFLFVLDRK
jgi:2-polyprenyl-3-methyl-5-hydroxy-6-metoxy-1,4-benzoquinol methylase